MPMHKVKISQTTRLERSIVVEVEADTMADAVERQSESDAPALDDPRWTVDSDSLEHEAVDPA